jgi:hypothetical protein
MPNKPAYKTQTVRRRNKVSSASEEANRLSPNTAPRNGPAPPTRRRRAVETLAEALTNAMKRAAGEKARKAIQQKGYLDWHTYVEASQQEFEQKLTRYT